MYSTNYNFIKVKKKKLKKNSNWFNKLISKKWLRKLNKLENF